MTRRQGDRSGTGAQSARLLWIGIEARPLFSPFAPVAQALSSRGSRRLVFEQEVTERTEESQVGVSSHLCAPQCPPWCFSSTIPVGIHWLRSGASSAPPKPRPSPRWYLFSVSLTVLVVEWGVDHGLRGLHGLIGLNRFSVSDLRVGSW